VSIIDSRQLIKGPDVIFQDLDGEAVLLNLRNGLYYGLDENSFSMYKILVSSESVEVAFDALCDEYDVEPDQLRLDLDRFLTDLLQNGLVIYADQEPS
jgi:hypothetical protein